MLPSSMAYIRHVVLITFILTIILTSIYFNKSTKVIDQDDLLKQVEPKKKSSVCDLVDMQWLAADRRYWDGWADKSMFVRPDGIFTQGNVYVEQGQAICAVVLLGPTPALSSIKPEKHFGPPDSIVLFAQGDKSKVTVQLEQHAIQPNVYFAPLSLPPDTYRLKTINEYRSYFWETPIYHKYRPFEYASHNNLTVYKPQTVAGSKLMLPVCDIKNKTAPLLQGAWIESSHYEQLEPSNFYRMFENSQDDFMVDDRVFVPEQCRLDYISAGAGARCLGQKKVHVWGDVNIKRNLKALDLTRQWCHLDNINAIQNEEERNEALKCDCHDTDDGYAWESDPKTPLRMGDSFNIDAHFYYNQLNAISFSSLAKTIQSGAALLPEADVVLVGVGNLDIKEIRISPNHFIKAFHELLLNFRKTYPKQTLIVRAPQYFCCGTLWGTSWNTGRSYAFYQIMKEMVDSFDNVLLWNTFSIGNEDSFCHAEGSSLSRRNVVNVENQLLWHLLC